MGLLTSKEEPAPQQCIPDRPESIISSKHHGHGRQPSIRTKSKRPMPEPIELERRFTEVLVSK